MVPSTSTWSVNQGSEFRESMEQVVVGHCCESGDLLTPAPGDREALLETPRGEIGDFA